MKKVMPLLLLLVFGSYNTCWAIDALPNANELVAESGRISVRVTVTSSPESQTCNAATSWRWGAEGICPKSFVGALEVKLGGMPLFVPLSAFADLGNPRTVSIELHKEKGRFAVVLTGGDAANSYSATLDFKDGHLNERVVRHGEFPEESWEKTIYKFNVK